MLFPLTLCQARSMTQMRQLQPDIKRLRELHKGNREALNAATVSLYQGHGVNQAGGCPPMLVQLPVMIVMYRVIRGLIYHDPAT